MKKVSIIGAGISGLTVGCYLQMNGFETHIYERHSVSGGLCAGWKKKQFTINGSGHWIMGNASGSSFYKLWSELLDLSSIQFVNHQLKIDIELKNHTDKYGDRTFHVYNHLAQFENYLIDIAPEDAKVIKRFIKRVKLLQKFDLPPIAVAESWSGRFIETIRMFRYIRLAPLMIRWARETNIAFANQFKNPFLREGFSLLYDNDAVKMLVFAVPLAALDKNSAGYPIGGSGVFVKKLEEKYISLGGKISCNAAVQEIIVNNNMIEGITLKGGQHIPSDIVVSAADWHFTFQKALKGNYNTAKSIALLEQSNFSVFYATIMLTFGVSGDFSSWAHYSRFPLKTNLISPDGTVYDRLEVHIYNYDLSLSPEGCTSIEVSFYTLKGDYWIDKRKEDYTTYLTLKNNFAASVIELLEERFGNIKSNICMIDVATPATYHRYTNNWKGSTQGWMPGKNLMDSQAVPHSVKGLQNFYFTGHWCVAGGGMPVAIKTGRDCAKLITKNQGKKFSIPMS